MFVRQYVVWVMNKNINFLSYEFKKKYEFYFHLSVILPKK